MFEKLNLILNSTDLPEYLIRRLRAFKDDSMDAGDIIRNLRHSKSHYGEEDIEYWKSKAPSRGREDLERLDDRYPRIMRALDRLTPFPGLWADISFAFPRRLVECACPMEICNYLNSIYGIWSTAFEEESIHVDVNSVRLVENLMPESTADKQLIESLMDNGTLFPSLGDENIRKSVLQRLLETKGRILSLHSLVQDTLFIQPCAKALRQLVPPAFLDLRDALMRRLETHEAAWTIQVSETVAETFTADLDSSSLACDGSICAVAYVQLWLFAMRYIENLTSATLPGRQKEFCDENHIYRETRQESSHELAILAQTLGFDSPQIRSLCKKRSAKSSARAFLTGRRPAERYDYPRHWLDKAPEKIVDILKLPMDKTSKSPAMPSLSFEGNGQLPVVQKRCGLPSWTTYQKNRQFLFVPHVYSPTQISGEHPSSFAILRDIIFSFFGRHLFPAGIKAPWLDTATEPHASPTRDNPGLSHEPVSLVQQESCRSLTPESLSPVSLEPHPPGTPPNPGALPPNQLEAELPSPVHQEETSLALVLRPPLAAGFEDDACIAPLGQRTFMTHHRGADEILTTWNRCHDSSLAVFYFFKTRQYCKFQLNHPNLDEHLRDFMDPISNDHYFADINSGLIHSDDVIQHIHQVPLILVYTDFEHKNPPNFGFRDYVCSFDVKTGKRQQREGEDTSSPEGKRRTKAWSRQSSEL
ncbi:uncharacterized protein BDW43DRAFT_317277 [Aspergillus alliaceus]|uniref:uncharacterized protein n=1 Tax=Petromyces alliaceus TaxID=209559 RepID=UPI0012A4E936|nr:uncharacterized protein BDW43DRAFT_317277 [Aspergillus alliaceus]KAB8226960.1 hypothetical protein BDW43DRAFT_317277 [Aspergillus alliaceus]